MQDISQTLYTWLKRGVLSMDVLARRISQHGALHLMENEDRRRQVWLTLCGRKIRASQALSAERFAGDDCCTVCARMKRSNESLHSRLATASQMLTLAG
ncbi:MAG: hypothetical protein KME52_01870 [Desmonostoc geniculatum HA4340-LM1]|nr:hypothetical protein [Desmonostoc geniculatum HA4340-LM1]